jgi:hypothetical protein
VVSEKHVEKDPTCSSSGRTGLPPEELHQDIKKMEGIQRPKDVPCGAVVDHGSPKVSWDP